MRWVAGTDARGCGGGAVVRPALLILRHPILNPTCLTPDLDRDLHVNESWFRLNPPLSEEYDERQWTSVSQHCRGK